MSEPRSLLEIAPDRPVTVRRILFEHPRSRCADLGIRPGDHLILGGWEGDGLVVRQRDGRAVRCPAELARFIEIG